MAVDEQQIESLRLSIDELREENQKRHEMIVLACNQIDLLYERLGQLEKSSNAGYDELAHRLDESDKIQDIIGHKLYPMFYKVFPEALEADEALDRAVQLDEALDRFCEEWNLARRAQLVEPALVRSRYQKRFKAHREALKA